MFVLRTNGEITSGFGAPQFEGQEEVADDDWALIAFVQRFDGLPPSQVSAGQLIQALAELNLLDAVDAAVAQADAMTQRLWARAAFFPRADPLVSGIATALGKTSDDLDDIFRLAATK